MKRKKCFSGFFLKIVETENETIQCEKMSNRLFERYLIYFLHQLEIRSAKAFEDGIIDLFLRLLFPKRVGDLKNIFRNKDILWVRVAVPIALMIVTCVLFIVFKIDFVVAPSWVDDAFFDMWSAILDH